MQKLYLDCDGVILDTINRSYIMLKELGITTEPQITEFYSTLNWEKLIKESGEINNSISKIKELSKYFDIEILTHINSEDEVRVKLKYFKENLPGIKVITVSKSIKKADFVDPKGAILVDDYNSNLDYWYEKGGIPIKFSDSGKENKYPAITDLLDLLQLDFNTKVKVKE